MMFKSILLNTIINKILIMNILIIKLNQINKKLNINILFQANELIHQII